MWSLFNILALSALVSAPPKPPCRTYTAGLSLGFVKARVEADRALPKEDPGQEIIRRNVQRFGFPKVAGGRPIANHNEHYTHSIEMGEATDQRESGRCWIFANCNVIRSILINRGKLPEEFQFSGSHLYFYAMLEKANTYLVRAMEAILEQAEKGEDLDRIQKPDFVVGLDDPYVVDGDEWSGSAFLIKKYGLVPQSIMPDTMSAQSSEILIQELMSELLYDVRQMVNIADKIIQGAKDKARPARTRQALQSFVLKAREDLWTILATHLGTPPTPDQEFEFRLEKMVKTFTPRTFVSDFLNIDPDDFVVVVSNPFRPSHGYYEMEGSSIAAPNKDEKPANLRMLNVSNDRLKELVVKSIRRKTPVWFGADVRLGVDHETGIMHPDIFRSDDVYGFRPKANAMPLKDRLIYGTTSPGHAMVISGFDLPDPNGSVVKFKVENSWGDERQIYHMYSSWFSQYVSMVVVPREVLSAEEARAVEGTPEMVNEENWEIP